MKWTPELLIAIILILGCLALMFCGVNGEVKTVFAMAAAWAFRSQVGAKQPVKEVK